MYIRFDLRDIIAFERKGMSHERGIPYPSGIGREVARLGWQRPPRFDNFLEQYGFADHDISLSDKRILESFYRWRHLVKARIFNPGEVAEKLEKRVLRTFEGDKQEADLFYERNLEIISLIARQTTPLTDKKR